MNEERQNHLDKIAGYMQCLSDFGIYRDGTQVIGCLETPVQQIILKIIEVNEITDEEMAEIDGSLYRVETR